MLYPSFQELLDLKAQASRRQIKSRLLTRSLASGGYFSPFRGQGIEFDEVRTYVPGDDVRKIDWRVTARSGVPHIKLFTEERERKVLICLDASDYMCFGTRGTFKSVQAARVAALLGWCTLASSNTIGTCIFGNSEEASMFFKPSRRQSSFLRFLETICRVDTYINTNAAKFNNDDVLDSHEPELRKSGAYAKGDVSVGQRPSLEVATKHIGRLIPPGTLVFIISDFLDMNDVLERNLQDINNRSELVLISINDPADLKIPNCGNVIFNPGILLPKWKKYFSSSISEGASVNKLHLGDLYADRSGSDVIIDTSNKTAQQQYSNVWSNLSSRIDVLKNEYGICHIQIMTNTEDLYAELFGGIARISRNRSR